MAKLLVIYTIGGGYLFAGGRSLIPEIQQKIDEASAKASMSPGIVGHAWYEVDIPETFSPMPTPLSTPPPEAASAELAAASAAHADPLGR